MLKSMLPMIAAKLDEEIDSGVREAAEEIVREAKARLEAQGAMDSGDLYDAIHPDKIVDGEWRVVAGSTKAWYGHIVEGGAIGAGAGSNVTIPPRPFLVPAAEAVRAHIDDHIRFALRDLPSVSAARSRF